MSITRRSIVPPTLPAASTDVLQGLRPMRRQAAYSAMRSQDMPLTLTRRIVASWAQHRSAFFCPSYTTSDPIADLPSLYLPQTDSDRVMSRVTIRLTPGCFLAAHALAYRSGLTADDEEENGPTRVGGSIQIRTLWRPLEGPPNISVVSTWRPPGSTLAQGLSGVPGGIAGLTSATVSNGWGGLERHKFASIEPPGIRTNANALRKWTRSGTLVDIEIAATGGARPMHVIVWEEPYATGWQETPTATDGPLPMHGPTSLSTLAVPFERRIATQSADSRYRYPQSGTRWCGEVANETAAELGGVLIQWNAWDESQSFTAEQSTYLVTATTWARVVNDATSYDPVQNGWSVASGAYARLWATSDDDQQCSRRGVIPVRLHVRASNDGDEDGWVRLRTQHSCIDCRVAPTGGDMEDHYGWGWIDVPRNPSGSSLVQEFVRAGTDSPMEVQSFTLYAGTR